MSPLDVVAVPGYPGMWARRDVIEAWMEAGSPPLNWAGRTFEEQLDLALHGPNAADDPRESWTRVPHVRGLALDLAKWTPAIVKRMEAAGFVRPITKKKGKPWPDGKGGFSQDEPWHFELKKYVDKVFDVPKVKAQTAGLDSKPFKEDDMTPTQAKQLAAVHAALPQIAAVYAGMFGNRNVTGKSTETTWVDPWGNKESTKYGLLPIDIRTQTLVAQLQGSVAALTALVQQLGVPGQPIDISALEAAAEKGAKEALSGLILTAQVDE